MSLIASNNPPFLRVGQQESQDPIYGREFAVNDGQETKIMSKTLNSTRETSNKLFLDLSTAASLAGFSSRHFRRIIEEDKIRTMRVGRKFFVLGSDFNSWQAAKAQHAN